MQGDYPPALYYTLQAWYPKVLVFITMGFLRFSGPRLGPHWNMGFDLPCEFRQTQTRRMKVLRWRGSTIERLYASFDLVLSGWTVGAAVDAFRRCASIEPEGEHFQTRHDPENRTWLHLNSCARLIGEETCSAFYIFPAPLHVTKVVDRLYHLSSRLPGVTISGYWSIFIERATPHRLCRVKLAHSCLEVHGRPLQRISSTDIHKT